LRLWVFLALVVLVVAIAVATRVAPADEYCKPGELKVDLNGTVICAVEVEDYKPIYASFIFQQSDGVFNVSMTCLYEASCNVSMSIYDYVNSTAVSVANVTEVVESGGSRSWGFSVSGRGIAVVYVNDVFLGAFTPATVEAPEEVTKNIKDLASTSPYVAVLAGLLIVSPSLGWMLQREWGVAGLALVGASTLIFIFVSALTGDVVVASFVSVLSGLLGIVYLVLSCGGS
jgi:hypothetical protein